MVKRILAGVLLLSLLAVAVYSLLDEKKSESTEADNEAEIQQEEDGSSSKGAGMVSPNAPEGLKVGEKAPDFTLETLNGETVNLSELKGKKVFINFWATWCPPCREEMPEMEKFHQEYGDEVEVLAINSTGAEKNIEKVESYVQEGGYTFPILLDPDLEMNQIYQAISIPTTYFIGTDGVIQQPRKVGPMTYDFMVEMKEKLN
ncbi:TlpA family protein disulfide reductase [Halobacillus yeomjeoni]|uniref:TlpA family protein disulfide reductase n=1 Tax=Halobacillus yeomjeoni TaxID=311194 RepID=UPI001CD4E0AF|nr:TlpA disulfide reductase family protein [Halobacillus yeomjeoni]MCA0983186.1 TlpA family protein disulfide reductase [Halobacillus yeomjeoni]